MQIFLLESTHNGTRMGLTICIVYRIIPIGLLFYDFELTTLDIVANGLVICVITSDIVISRMSGRELHPFVVILVMLSVFSNILVFMLVVGYYSLVLYEVTAYTSLPLLTTNVNVYCDGIYDCLHIGHMKAFKNALKFGTRLYVGVVSDEKATPYKRKPIMTTKVIEILIFA